MMTISVSKEDGRLNAGAPPMIASWRGATRARQVRVLVVLAAVGLAMALAMSAQTAWAGSWLESIGEVPSIKAKTVTTFYYPKKSKAYNQVFYFSEVGDFTKVKSSNSKIATVKSGGDYLVVTKKKPGKTRVSFALNKKNYSFTLNVKKYVCPVSVFKVGSKNYAKKFTKYDHYMPDQVKPFPVGKVTIKAAKGWKLQKIKMYYKDGKTRTIKNGVKLKKGWEVYNLEAKFKNRKTGQTETINMTKAFN